MKTLLTFAALTLISVPFAQAETICERRANARHHTRISQARLEFTQRRASCQTLPVPDRIVQCIDAAHRTFEQKSQNSRERLAADRRACENET